uniref:Uncharacterized protein n=1 Tax=Anguilla anguilla TaxID=7936 RepID=A0A0E9S6X7_ANGAN
MSVIKLIVCLVCIGAERTMS